MDKFGVELDSSGIRCDGEGDCYQNLNDQESPRRGPLFDPRIEVRKHGSHLEESSKEEE
jgi:hypothetical protein